MWYDGGRKGLILVKRNEKIPVWVVDSPVGRLTLAEDAGALAGLWLEGQRNFPAGLEPCREPTPTLALAEDWLRRYFAGEKPEISQLPLKPAGSEFSRQVWEILCRIPYGSTVTYGAIAGELAQKRGLARMSARAVGGAVGRNPISIIIPCHRVVGSDGALTGYAGGLERKKWLLEWEMNGTRRSL